MKCLLGFQVRCVTDKRHTILGTPCSQGKRNDLQQAMDDIPQKK